jgi:pyruvate dehydrogenase E2 component (dihydrolipoamide acetyltransferase)
VTAMPVEVIMPKVDMDMARGKFALWHVKEGGSVAKGAPLFDIETDKSAMEVESPAAGRLRHVTAKPGEEIDVGATIAWIFAEGEAVGEAAAMPAELDKAAAVFTSPTIETMPRTPAAPAGKIAATPLARRMARLDGLDLSLLSGTGPRQRIQKTDVEAAMQKTAESPAAETTAASDPVLPSSEVSAPDVLKFYSGRPFTEIPTGRMRSVIAKRLTEAKQTVPHFYLRREVNLDRLLEFRAQLNASMSARGVKLSVNDFVVKAAALALQAVPEANVIWGGDRMLRFERSDIAVAVAVEGGLFTPVLRDADTKSLTAVSREIKEFASRARERGLSGAQCQGGSMAVSNLGMHGVDDFDAIINPPQSAILAVGAAREKPVIAEDRTIAIATMMKLTLSVDHRAIDGALGAALIQSIKSHLENPMAILA